MAYGPATPNAPAFHAGSPEPKAMTPMKTKTHFAFRVDVWDDGGDSIEFESLRARQGINNLGGPLVGPKGVSAICPQSRLGAALQLKTWQAQTGIWHRLELLCSRFIQGSFD